MALTYAIADLHGRFDLLSAALAKLETRDPGTVVFLGDYVDRGPQSRQIIQRLMDGPAPPWQWVCLQGNHESMMIETLTAPLHPQWWIGNGGGATLVSYGHPKSGRYQPAFVPADHIWWLRHLPMMHVDAHRIFVHASVDPTVPIDEQREQFLQWHLHPEGYDLLAHGRHVVHGHHQFAEGPILLANRTDLDTFAWYTGRLVIGVFDDDKPGGPVEIIEVVGAPYEALRATGAK